MVVPLARRLAGGGRDCITMLQRVGAGMATACLATVVAALVEARRLRVARDTRTGQTRRCRWMCGVAKVLSVIVLEEFFYELHIVRLAVSLRSLCPRAISSHQATFQRK
ncbi:hypothetical protein OsJ_26281 [Oryza sativa Japonica Group]|uniref:Uncharacterized protein n=1 Tax=Oryza sativa subsp. japonica TaxID=39947 RepID=Q6ZC95_ORYSJ|nr:hypothetical protein OsJ_26281 [Oryza sativa Japonica Group]BAD03190.1 hypothetical protein [Oryza sativa Japonica Group]BAD03319.1 hypothetical protein [Oryza sativa Japonica Group]